MIVVVKKVKGSQVSESVKRKGNELNFKLEEHVEARSFVAFTSRQASESERNP